MYRRIQQASKAASFGATTLGKLAVSYRGRARSRVHPENAASDRRIEGYALSVRCRAGRELKRVTERGVPGLTVPIAARERGMPSCAMCIRSLPRRPGIEACNRTRRSRSNCSDCSARAWNAELRDVHKILDRARSADTIDAMVIATADAEPGSAILTSDPAGPAPRGKRHRSDRNHPAIVRGSRPPPKQNTHPKRRPVGRHPTPV